MPIWFQYARWSREAMVPYSDWLKSPLGGGDVVVAGRHIPGMLEFGEQLQSERDVLRTVPIDQITQQDRQVRRLGVYAVDQGSKRWPGGFDAGPTRVNPFVRIRFGNQMNIAYDCHLQPLISSTTQV